MKNIISSFAVLLIFPVCQYSLSAQTDTAAVMPGADIISGIPETESTAAISYVSGEELYHSPTANLTNTIYGLLPGLVVQQGSGEPGYDAATLNIRGIGSYTYGSYAVYVDGFQTDMTYAQYLTAEEIESVAILKDAAALATFGMKGANGVLWITTKRGKPGKPEIRVKFRAGMQQLANITGPLDSWNYATLYNEANSNDRGMVWTPVYSDRQLGYYLNGRGTDIDWHDKVLKRFTPFWSADASFTGGTENARYFVLADFTQTNGMYNVRNDDNHSNARLDQFNIRSNFDFTVFDFIDGKVDFGGRIESRRYPAISGSDLWSVLERYPSNIYPVKNTDGTWTGTMVYPNNPVASIRELGLNSTHDRSMQINMSLKERLDFLTEGLYIYESVSFSNWMRGSRNVTKNYARYLNSVIQTSDMDTNWSIYDDNGTSQWNWLQVKVGAGYERTFGLHSIKAGIQWLHYTHNVDADQNGAAGVNTEYSYVNASARLHWSYAGRYAAEINAAYSGSDNYRPGNRYRIFPSASFAWTLSNEEFLAGSENVDLLKLRLSAGMAGYDTLGYGRYLYQQYYSYSGSYPVGNGDPTWQGGIVQPYIADPDITAETSTKFNVGVDATFFKGLDITVDAFLDKRSGIVSEDNSIMGAAGESIMYRNLGKVTTKGLEFSINWHQKAGDFNYGIGIIGTWIRDRIDYMAEITPPSIYAAQTGNAIGTIFGYEALGFYDITDFDENGSLVSGIPVPAIGQVQPGDIRYRDINGDDIIDERDRTVIGNPSFPEFTGSLLLQAGYKGFDLRILLQGTAGRDISLLDQAYNKVVAFENNGNAYPIALGRWAYYPEQGIDTRDTATYPRLSTTANSNNYVNSSFWVKSGDFLKLRNIEIGYSLPESALAKLKMKEARIYLSGMNLFTFSRLLKDYDIDPENPSGYPGIRSYNIGISVTF